MCVCVCVCLGGCVSVCVYTHKRVRARNLGLPTSWFHIACFANFCRYARWCSTFEPPCDVDVSPEELAAMWSHVFGPNMTTQHGTPLSIT